MPRVPTIDELLASDRNADPFRLAIFGFAAIEQAVNQGLAETFGGALPDELRRTHFNTRVALARALNLIPDELRDPLGRLAQLRHDFAHGKVDDLTPSRARELFASVKSAFPDIETVAPELKDAEPPAILAALLLLLQEALVGAFEDALEGRVRQEEAMREWWKRRTRKLTREEIMNLLDSAEESDD